jgi:hypothetical protein
LISHRYFSLKLKAESVIAERAKLKAERIIAQSLKLKAERKRLKIEL